MNKLTNLALLGMLLVGTVACSSAKTSTNAPDTTTSASPTTGTTDTAASPSTSPANGTVEGNKTAPNAAASPSASPTAGTVQANKNDATSDVRRKQLESDIRSREQRNNITGGDAIRADSDLASEVRSKLEANLPKSSLKVDAKSGAVVVTGSVPAKDQLAKIPTLAKQIKGVKSVKVDAQVGKAAN